MRYQTFDPPPYLKDLVQCFWSLESWPDEITPKKYFLMADSSAEIIFQYKGGFKSYAQNSARVRFQHATCNEFVVDKQIGFFGARLYPTAATKLMGFPASKVTELVFDVCDLFKQKGRDVSDQIFNAQTSYQRVAILSQFLRSNTSTEKGNPISQSITQVIKTHGQLDIFHLRKQSGLSIAQFERRFKFIAGFTPKYFARITRFQSAKDSYSSTNKTTLTKLSYDCNYYDQSHFIRDFREFSGVRPNHYFAGKTNEKSFDGYLPCGWFA
jgi:AraC-like DNA-binding protein